jgi:hypothetical protein
MATLDQARKTAQLALAQDLLDSIADTETTPQVNPLQEPLDAAITKLTAARAGLLAAKEAIDAALDEAA